MSTHVILVAFQVEGDTRKDAHEQLFDYLPNHPSPKTTPGLECWWVAEDDRLDNSDNDSAVFVTPGKQRIASFILGDQGLISGIWNLVPAEQSPGRFEA